MLSTLWSICSGVLSASDSRLKYGLIGLLVGAVATGSTVHYVWSLRADRQQAEQQKIVVAQTAAAQAAEKATAVIKERYDETIKTAAAVAVSNAGIIDGMRKQLANLKSKPRATGCANAEARFQRLAESAVRTAELSISLAEQLAKAEAQLRSLQDWVKVTR